MSRRWTMRQTLDVTAGRCYSSPVKRRRQRPWRYLGVLLVGLGGAAAVSPAAATADAPVVLDRVVAVVNDAIILQSDLVGEMGLDPRVVELRRKAAEGVLGSAGAQAELDKLENELLQRLVERELVLAEARRFGLEVGPADERRALQSLAGDNGFATIKELERAVLASGAFENWEEYLEDLRRSILEAQVLQYMAPGRVTEAQVREYYRKMSRGEDARVEIAKLEFRASDATPEASDAAYQRAQSAAKRLRSGADPFALEDDSAEGPAQVEVGRGDIQPALEDRIFAAKPGEIVGPIATGGGFVVLRIERQVDGDVLSYEEAKGRIRQQLEYEAQLKARGELMDKLRAKAHLEIRM